MPTIPLYDASAPADGYHRVMAPGGYECWRVFAGASQLEIVFLEGNYLSLAYESAYKRYLAAPKRVAPPVPRDYPLVVIGLADHIFRPPAAKGSFHFVSEPPTVKIGDSSILWSSHRLLVITLAAADASGRVTL